jgi:hypothetical protein
MIHREEATNPLRLYPKGRNDHESEGNVNGPSFKDFKARQSLETKHEFIALCILSKMPEPCTCTLPLPPPSPFIRRKKASPGMLHGPVGPLFVYGDDNQSISRTSPHSGAHDNEYITVLEYLMSEPDPMVDP